MTPKTFDVLTTDGRVPAEQMATLTHTVGNITHRLVVVRDLARSGTFSVTDRASRKRVASYSAFELISAQHDHKVAAASAINKLVLFIGAEKFNQVMKEA